MQSLEETRQTRRIQVSGGSTYTISLPKKWVEELGIKNGDNMTIVKNSNKSFTIFSESAGKRTRNATILIAQKEPTESIRRKIVALYIGGYKIIKIKTKGVKIPTAHVTTIKDLVRRSMIGTEIVESDPESVTIQVVTRLPELTFNVALRRMHLLTADMHRWAIDAIERLDTEAADEVVKMDDEVDRFGLYMMRTLVMAIQNADILFDVGLRQPSDCLNYRTAISRIERIADHACLIAKQTKFLKQKPNEEILKEIKKLSENAVKCFETSINALLKNDHTLAESVSGDISNLIQQQKHLLQRIGDMKDFTSLRFILEDIKRTAEYSNDIVEVVINETIDQIIAK